jgi:DNA-binding response OmpR family regulator
LRILLVKDDTQTANYILRGLNEAGHNVATSADGRDGLFRAAGEDWDLLIVDRMLPRLDGIALVRTLRSSGIECPVLFLTTLGGIDDRDAGLNAGGDDYLIKPCRGRNRLDPICGPRRKHPAVVREVVAALIGRSPEFFYLLQNSKGQASPPHTCAGSQHCGPSP